MGAISGDERSEDHTPLNVSAWERIKGIFFLIPLWPEQATEQVVVNWRRR